MKTKLKVTLEALFQWVVVSLSKPGEHRKGQSWSSKSLFFCSSYLRRRLFVDLSSGFLSNICNFFFFWLGYCPYFEEDKNPFLQKLQNWSYRIIEYTWISRVVGNSWEGLRGFQNAFGGEEHFPSLALPLSPMGPFLLFLCSLCWSPTDSGWLPSATNFPTPLGCLYTLLLHAGALCGFCELSNHLYFGCTTWSLILSCHFQLLLEI